VLTDPLDCRSRWTAWGLGDAANSGPSLGPNAHRVRAKSMSEAALRWPNRGSSGGHQKVAELARRGLVDSSMEGALGSEPRGVGASREDGSSVLRGRFASADHTAGCDRECHRSARPARVRQKMLARVRCTRARGSPFTREVGANRSRCPRRPIAAPLGAGCAGNSAPASATSSSTFSACKRTRDGVAGEAPIGIVQTTSPRVVRSMGARGNQSAAEIANEHLAAPRRPP
jgi:hypothetical protein